jgi:hypothetical protein
MLGQCNAESMILLIVTQAQTGTELVRLKIAYGQPTETEGDDQWIDYSYRPFSPRWGRAVSWQENNEEWARALAAAYAGNPDTHIEAHEVDQGSVYEQLGMADIQAQPEDSWPAISEVPAPTFPQPAPHLSWSPSLDIDPSTIATRQPPPPFKHHHPPIMRVLQWVFVAFLTACFAFIVTWRLVPHSKPSLVPPASATAGAVIIDSQPTQVFFYLRGTELSVQTDNLASLAKLRGHHVTLSCRSGTQLATKTLSWPSNQRWVSTTFHTTLVLPTTCSVSPSGQSPFASVMFSD